MDINQYIEEIVEVSSIDGVNELLQKGYVYIDSYIDVRSDAMHDTISRQVFLVGRINKSRELT